MVSTPVLSKCFCLNLGWAGGGGEGGCDVIFNVTEGG